MYGKKKTKKPVKPKKKKQNSMKWQYDQPFCKWLLKQRYGEMRDGTVFPFLTGGTVLYMHEAFRQGFTARKEANGSVLTR